MNGAPLASRAAPAPASPFKLPKASPVHPHYPWVGLLLVLSVIPLIVFVNIALGYYVPDVGYIDPLAVAVGGGLVLLLWPIGFGLIYFARMPLTYPRPPFAAVNPPSSFQSTFANPYPDAHLRDGVPPMYFGGTYVSEHESPGLGSSTSIDQFSARQIRCPRCGWSGTVHGYNCPRCGLGV